MISFTKYFISIIIFPMSNSINNTAVNIVTIIIDDNNNGYNISNAFKFKGIDIELYGKGQINLGKNTYIGNRSVLSSDYNCIISIGDNCAISHNVRIYTSNRNPNDIIFENKNITKISGDVIIGNNVWIGANVFINQGITIGDHCVVGANTVVTKSIPSNCLVVGTPGRIIKQKDK